MTSRDHVVGASRIGIGGTDPIATAVMDELRPLRSETWGTYLQRHLDESAR